MLAAAGLRRRRDFETLVYHLRERRVTLRLGEKVTSIELFREDGQSPVNTFLVSGKQIVADQALSSTGRNRRDRRPESGRGRTSTERAAA